MRELEEIALTLDEIEAIRLADIEDLYQAHAAERMGVSRQTFGTIVARARKKVAQALLHGKALRIDTTSHEFLQPAETRDTPLAIELAASKETT